jgi:cell division protein FtsW (lipid II flippase)
VLSPTLTDRHRASGRRWAPVRADVWLAGALAVGSAVWVLLALDPDTPYRPVDVLALLLAVAAASGLLWRQVAPLAAMAVTGALVVVNAAARNPVGPVQFPMWIALFRHQELQPFLRSPRGGS